MSHRPVTNAASARRQLGRFVAIGPLGVALGAVQYELLWLLNPLAEHRAATTWLISSAIGVAWVHALHCQFTFRGPQSARWRDTIGRAYLIYSASIVLGALFMWGLVDRIGVVRGLAWVVTTAATSLLNFVLLRRLVAGTTPSPAAALALPDITVVVPTKNERENVPRFLRALPPEIALVVVDASDDGTDELVRALRPERTRVIRCPGNIPTARQRGADEASTPWLLFTDVDVRFDDGYFSRLAAMRPSEGTGGIIGAKRAGGRFAGYDAVFALGQRLCATLGIPAASGSNMLIARTALADAGGFDRDLSVNEDSEVMWRVARAGWTVRFEPRLIVTETDHRRLRRGVARKLLHSGVRCVLLYLGLLPRRWRMADWGYWPGPAPVGEAE